MSGVGSSDDPAADNGCPTPSLAGALPAGEEEELAPLFKALADPVRLRLLSMISSAAEGEVCVCHLTGAFDLTAPTISYHLKLLRTAGLISGQRRGTWVYYRAIPQTLSRLAAVLAPFVPAVTVR